MKPMRTRMLLLLLVTLVLPACAGPEKETLPLRRIDSDDQRWAEQVEIDPSVLPDEFVGTPPSEEAGRRATGCDEIDYSDLTLTGEATGDSYFDGERLLALSATQVYATAEDARASVERGSGEDSSRCIREAFRNTVTRIDEGFDVAELTVSEAEAPNVGELSRRYEVILDYEVGGDRVPGFFDIYLVQRDRAVVALFLGGIERFPADLTEGVLEAVDAQMRESPPPAAG
jgi:hypothetical protein